MAVRWASTSFLRSTLPFELAARCMWRPLAPQQVAAALEAHLAAQFAARRRARNAAAARPSATAAPSARRRIGSVAATKRRACLSHLLVGAATPRLLHYPRHLCARSPTRRMPLLRLQARTCQMWPRPHDRSLTCPHLPCCRHVSQMLRRARARTARTLPGAQGAPPPLRRSARAPPPSANVFEPELRGAHFCVTRSYVLKT